MIYPLNRKNEPPLFPATCSQLKLALFFHVRARVRLKHGTYHAIFTTLFAKSARTQLSVEDQKQVGGADSGDTDLGPELTVESYDVINGVYPTDERVREADAVLLTGSGTSLALDGPAGMTLIVEADHAVYASTLQRARRTHHFHGLTS